MSVTFHTEARRELRDRAERLCRAGFHACGSVLFDGALFGSLVDSFVDLGEHGGRLFRALAEDELAHIFDRVFHRLLAARIEDTPTFRGAHCFLCRTCISHNAADSTLYPQKYQVAGSRYQT